ncbi:Hsp70 family protein [Anaeromyxobacter oryzisoli]|jgi:molecular chaperone DnaK|uniref:Hsp70 family protein n=1 Tax=Anaeromyxobacter oryzisoli TaxID=2925408 RepID=UPI001F58FF6A|nr:Hsp70 family protein [Anaeromyxobacter sp. SG63]
MEKLPPDTIIGIDLGTTNSCGAVAYGDGQVKLIPYQGGEYTIPSVYAIDDKGHELIGHEAKRQWQLNPRNTLYATKRLIGRAPKDEVVESVRRSVQYRVQPGSQNDVALDCHGRTFHVPEISAKILAKIRDVASDHLGFKVQRAVVTVPAYFNDRQRQAVKEAGTLVDLDVVRIINEPTAAALAYGIGKRLHERVLIYDLGGGTFDVSIIDIRERVFEVKATGGDVFLGGLDFDNAMIEHVLDDFRRKHGIDLSSDPVAMQRIKDLAERTKIDLSARAEAPFSIPFITMTPQGQPLDLDLRFDRTLLEALTQHLVDRTLEITGKVMADAGVTAKDIDEVMLVGGQTRMPIVQERLTRFFGKAPSKGVHPDEAVAIGAALYGWSLGESSDPRIQLLDVIPMAIGIEQAGGTMHVVFPRNASIPNAKTVAATSSVDGQRELVVRIFQGDHPETAANELLGEFTFSGVRPGRAGEVRLELLFEVNIEGILTMSARDLDTGRKTQTNVRVAAA